MTDTAMRRRRSLVALLAGLLAGCRPAPAPPNVLVIVADTLRADRLATYGSERGLTPFLESLAARSTVFQRAYSNSPWTLPSIATLFTSRFASQHGVVARDSVLADTEVTLAEVLRGRGYATAAVSANGLMRPQGGFAQGFDLFDVLWVHTKESKVVGELVNRVALAWLDGLRRGAAPPPPTFLYLHYMEPHLPYLPSPAALDRILAGRPAPDLDALNALTPIMPIQPDLDRRLPDLWDGYNASVATLDNTLFALFVELGTRGFLDNALVVFTADHGEEFLEHGRFGHGEALYNEVVHVPLFIQMPGQKTRIDVPGVTSLVDVAPTILRQLGIDEPTRFVGTPWTAPAPGTSPEPRPAFVELIPLPGNAVPAARAVVAGPHKKITADDGTSVAFNLTTDPGERNPHDLDPAAQAPLDRLLTAFGERVHEQNATRVVEPLDDAARARLRALGYTQ